MQLNLFLAILMTITSILLSLIGEIVTQPPDTNPTASVDVTESPSGSNNAVPIVGTMMVPVIAIALNILIAIVW